MLSPAQLTRALRWETALALVVVAVGVIGTASSPEFLTGNNFFNLGLSNGEIAIMTLPMTLIVISGEIDLSVASILGMSSALIGVLWSKGLPMPAIFLIIALAGLAAGAVNGLLVTRFGLPSLAVTIGTLALYRGIAVILLGPKTISNFPAGYADVGVSTIPGIPDLSYSAAIFLILAVVFGIVLHATPFGRSVYAMGASPEAALFAGIRVKRIKTILFMISGLICAMAGALWTFRLSTAVQDNGTGLELSVVAIVLLAGVSIFGGKGSVAGVVLAVLAFAGIQNALLLTNFNQEATGVVTGGLLLISVFVPNVSATDPTALCPTLNAAMSRGITVVTYDSDAPGCRSLFINQASAQGVGTSEVDLIAKAIHNKGDIAIVSAAASATNQNAWIGYMKQELKKFPDIHLVTTVYGNDDPTTATQVTQGLLQQYPNLAGIISPTTVGIAAAAALLDTARYRGKVALTGLGTPGSLKKYVDDGTIGSFELWNPANLGYLAAYAAVSLAAKKITNAAGQSFTAGKLGTFAIGADDTIVLGPPLVFTKSNIGNFNWGF